MSRDDFASVPLPTEEESRREVRRTRLLRLGSWLGLAVIAGVALAASAASARLSDHATGRRQVMEELTQLEVSATEHSMTIWRALTLLMAGEKMQFLRLRGQANMKRKEIDAQMGRLIELQMEGNALNDWLGFEADPASLEALEASTSRFLGNVQGAFGQMNLSAERLRKRLRHWDMNFGSFKESLDAVKAKNGEIALASATFSKQVTTAAGIARLIASALIVFTIGRVRARRGVEAGSKLDRFADQHNGKKLARRVALEVGKVA